MPQAKITDMSGFELGTPSLVCRWRIANRKLPLENRHLRALHAREVKGEQVSKELVAWAKQHIEWTLDKGAAAYPNGVLMLIIDAEGRAAMTVGPYEPLPETRLSYLARRAEHAQLEAAKTRVAPETLWLAHGDQLIWDQGEGCQPSGAASLVVQLAQTMGIPVSTYQGLPDAVATGAIAFDEAFLVSDEHGIVPAIDARGSQGVRMAQGYQRLLER